VLRAVLEHHPHRTITHLGREPRGRLVIRHRISQDLEPATNPGRFTPAGTWRHCARSITTSAGCLRGALPSCQLHQRPGHLSRNSNLVCRTFQTNLDAPELGFSSGLECIVRLDGCEPLAAVAQFERSRRLAIGLFFTQLALNAAWSPVFFGLHQIEWAIVVIVGLALAIAATIAVAWDTSRAAAWLLVPYLAWVIYAASLNSAIALLND